MQISPNVSSYKDRHGKTRWRYRKGTIAISLRGNPGDSEFEEAVANAVRGEIILGHKIIARRSAMVEHYSAAAIARANYRARQKKMPFSLTTDDFREMIEKQDFKCAVSGISFPIERVVDDSMKAFRPSIDRIVPSIGYVRGNVRLVCEIANLAMNQWGERALMALVDAMANRMANPSGEPIADVA